MPPKRSARSEAGGRLEATVANRHPQLRGAGTARRALRVLDAQRGEFEIEGSVLGGANAPRTLDAHSVPKAVRPSVRGAFAPPADRELSLVFMTDGDLAALHGRFLGDPAPTDVITFPGEAAHGQIGEICVSVDAARRQPRRRFSDELALYVVHGWLHLAGHDDLQPAKKRRMRRAEARALSVLRAAQAMPRFTLAKNSR